LNIGIFKKRAGWLVFGFLGGKWYDGGENKGENWAI
jgi:hypothetical protein